MTFIIQNFGPNLARLRIEKGVSQTQLAEDLGIGKQSISDYEKAKYSHSRDEPLPTVSQGGEPNEIIYHAPEQVLGWSYDSVVEWWSFGLVVYWMLTAAVRNHSSRSPSCYS